MELARFMCGWLWYAYRSLRSLAFFKPPKAILVPGMYFLGFSRYSNWRGVSGCSRRKVLRDSYESVITPVDTLALVGVGVGVTLDLTGLSAPKSVKVGSGIVVSV
jgi:hypothetical protein